ncbi:MAG: phosphoribosylanthranilate isomerase [Oscillospiraceae bacterium]|nr:phosphoribosylanthranilate isomerase [Oscillospiraceae bacterium]
MAVKVKVGGICYLEDVDVINRVKPDFAGVDLCKRYRHGVTTEMAKQIRERLDSSIPLVGMFVNDSFMDVLVALRQGYIDIAQLQGTESEEYIHDLKIMSRKPVIKSFEIASPSEMPESLETCADHVLLCCPPDSGKLLDWDKAQTYERPFILSGTLTPDNLELAIKTAHPWGVNLVNGVETPDRHKAYDKLMRAMEIARAAESL